MAIPVPLFQRAAILCGSRGVALQEPWSNLRNSVTPGDLICSLLSFDAEHPRTVVHSRRLKIPNWAILSYYVIGCGSAVPQIETKRIHCNG